MVFLDHRATELPVLIRASVDVSQSAVIVSNYQRPSGGTTQMGTRRVCKVKF